VLRIGPSRGNPLAKALTAAGVEKAKANPDKRQEIPDGLLAGLYLIVQPVQRLLAGLISALLCSLAVFANGRFDVRGSYRRSHKKERNRQ